MTRTPDEIMAEYLLNGGKMLNEMCAVCGAPLFEVKGVKKCVVCAENTKPKEPQNDNVHVIMPKYASEDTGCAPNELTSEIDSLIHLYLEKAKTEVDPARCLTLMECVRTAAEAKTILARFK